MGLLRSIASRVARKLAGAPEASAPKAAAPATPRPAAPRPAPPTPSGDNAAHLARIDCGAQELKERLDAGEKIVVVDVREDAEVASGTLPNARHIPLGQLAARWEELKDADEIVCYCAAGMRSMRAAQLLRDNGLINATSLEGDIGAWREIGGAIQTR